MAVNRNWCRIEAGRLVFAPTWLKIGDGIVVNPTDEQYLALGWLRNARNAPETREGYVARVEGYETRDGRIYAVYAYDVVTPPPRVLSKLKIVIALKKRSLWTRFLCILSESDLEDEWNAAQDISEDFPGFAETLLRLGVALGLSDAEVEEILGEAVAR